MPTWTKEQTKAIKESGQNIIVSAGAGSGKTAVLSERVLDKLKQNIHINELLILTFTNAAAAEMKERIRKKITKEQSLKEELILLDSAYITTFDSFALSIVKKYHNVLNITNKVTIADETLITIKTNELLDEVMDELYKEEDSAFLKLISDFSLKDDKLLKNSLLNIYKNISLKYNPKEYLDNIDYYFTKDKINSYLDEYLENFYLNIEVIKNILKELSLSFNTDYMDKLYNSLNGLINSTTYDEIKRNLEIKLPPVPRNTEESIKNLKNKITSIIKDMKKLALYDNTTEIKEEIKSTYNNTKEVTLILKRLIEKVNLYKQKEDLYDFNDIFHLAIKVVKENKDVREELKQSFKEILIDEYQDTSDLQELFISMIENNNVYMVGDIKQSIYRFRNANPYIFKEKYDKYTNKDNGLKIDLNKNFRSRKEVLDNINEIFNEIMSDNIGGADYKSTHQMNFGNMTYEEEGNTQQDYNLKIKTYEERADFDNSVLEAFIIGEDIKEKINNKFKVYTPGDNTTRNIDYKDFAILLDRSKDFSLYKKILDYLEIPSTILKDEELNSGNDILIIKNIFKLINFISKRKKDLDFKYSFLSLGRSFLFNLSDEELFSYFINNNFDESDIYLKCFKISKNIEEKNPKRILDEIIEEFNYEEKLISLADIKQKRVRLEYIQSFINNLSNNGYTLEEVIEYLDTVFENNLNLTFKGNEENSNSVLIMTIHKSKGLEFPICYFSGFKKKFNFHELKDKIIYNNKYGIVLPKVSDCYKSTIIKELVKQDSKKEEISEKIRLLYVALTRAKENMIIVCPEFLEEKKDTSVFNKMRYKSFYDILDSINYYLDRYIEKVDVKPTNEYLNTNFDDFLEVDLKDEFFVEEISLPKQEIEEKRFSKNTLTLQTKEDKEKLEEGTRFHEILEMLDFKNPNLNLFETKEQELITNFLNQDLIKNNINEKFYHEYEFLDKKENEIFHGIIDLMIEKSDKIIIIDYKLKNIEDDEYKKQLAGYKDAIGKKTNKKVDTYLYSILENKFKEVKEKIC